jgi:hypothetical protein
VDGARQSWSHLLFLVVTVLVVAAIFAVRAYVARSCAADLRPRPGAGWIVGWWSPGGSLARGRDPCCLAAWVLTLLDLVWALAGSLAGSSCSPAARSSRILA